MHLCENLGFHCSCHVQWVTAQWVVWSIDWLICYVTGQLTGWLIDCFACRGASDRSKRHSTAWWTFFLISRSQHSSKMKFGKTARLVSMLSVTSSFFLVELIVGYKCHSMALVADSFHMLSDVLALLVAFLSVRISKRTSSKNTFGWARAEVLGALVNSVFLMALCFSIFVEAIDRFHEPTTVDDPKLVLIVGCVGLAVNLFGLLIFHRKLPIIN